MPRSDLDAFLRHWARLGYAAKGVIYGLTGGLALLAALGRPAPVTDPAGALMTVARHPAGRGVLLITAIGLAAYGSFHALKGLVDPERRGRTVWMALVRAGELATAGAHGLLALGALKLAMRTGAPHTGDERAREVSTGLLALPYGGALMVVAAAAIMVLGLSLIVRAGLEREACGDLRLDGLGRLGCRAVAAVLRLARGAQGTLFFAVGWLLLRAGLTEQPARAKGIGGALRFLAEGPPGRVLPAIAALGLVAIGAAGFIDARWHRFEPRRG